MFKWMKDEDGALTLRIAGFVYVTFYKRSALVSYFNRRRFTPWTEKYL